MSSSSQPLPIIILCHGHEILRNKSATYTHVQLSEHLGISWCVCFVMVVHFLFHVEDI